jgi:chromosome segregation ATPase
LVEIDRGRQAAKDTAKEHERQLKELRTQITQLQVQRDDLKRDLHEARSELRTVLSLRAREEKRHAAFNSRPKKDARATASKTPVAARTPTVKPRR